MDEIKELLKDNNRMLKRITAYLDKIESPSYKENEDVRNMAINLAADSIIEMIGNRRNNNNQIFYR